MDGQVTYAELNVSRNSGLKNSSLPPVPQGICQGAPWHQLALKIGCAGLILLSLTVIGLSFLERSSLLKCPEDWIELGEKCFFISSSSKSWNHSLADCFKKESYLLLIQDEEELKLIQNQISDKGYNFWIGLNFTLSEKKWKWINGSDLNSKILQVNDEEKENNCAYISQKKTAFENCNAENKWICQKNLNIRNKPCSV
ncbi:PREDICTED: killer cell lectin-like receptor subfamily B member 1 [Condylura cristata]|uniref:killer cell lectin-like receptor subfamily B member 1 n=1 Tax=Condylura cristata TaxID=143302 RepID=UPI000642D5F2|nr:PREDICTED: killer cell lectin-like receptor subfamily B member 1 [Condylura cristata]